MGTLTWDKEIQGFPSTGFESGGEGTDDHPWGEDWMQKVIAAQWGENGLILIGDAYGSLTTLDSKDFSVVNQTLGSGQGPSPFRNTLAGMWCRTSADPVNGQPLWLIGGIQSPSGFDQQGFLITKPLITVSTDGGLNNFSANMPSSPFSYVDGSINYNGYIDAFSYDTASGTMYARMVGTVLAISTFFVISSGDGMNWNISAGPYPYDFSTMETSSANLPGFAAAPPTPATNKLARIGAPSYPYAVGTLKSTTPGKSGGTYVAQMAVTENTEFLTSLTFTGVAGTSSSFSSMPSSQFIEPAIVWTAGKFVLVGGVNPNNIMPALAWTNDGKTWNEIDNIMLPAPFSNSAAAVAAGPKGHQHP